MAVTYTPTRLGRFQSRLNGQLFCVAAGGTEAVTLVHNLGASLTKPPTLRVRSLIAGGSGAPSFRASSWNASQVVAFFDSQPLGALAVTADVLCELTYRTVQ